MVAAVAAPRRRAEVVIGVTFLTGARVKQTAKASAHQRTLLRTHAVPAAMFSLKPKWNVDKTKVNLKMLVNRLNLLTQKKANLAKQQKRQVAHQLRDDKEGSARILVEHIIREDYTLESYELLKQYAELLLARLNVMATEDDLKPEIAEAVCSLLYAGYLMANEVPELKTLLGLFTAKYGKEYAAEVVEHKEKYLNPRLLKMLTNTQVPDPSVIELYLKEIARAYNVEWIPRPVADGPTGPVSSTIGVPLPMPGMPIEEPVGPVTGEPVPPTAPPVAPVASLPVAKPAEPAPPAGPSAGPATGIRLDPLSPGESAEAVTDGFGVPYGVTPPPSGPAAHSPAPIAVTLVKSPAGFGLVVDDDNVVAVVKPFGEAERSGEPCRDTAEIETEIASRDRAEIAATRSRSISPAQARSTWATLWS